MTKKCTIYYGRVIEDLSSQPRSWKGSIHLEPIEANEGKLIGKAPKYCCDDFDNALTKDYQLVFYGDEDGFHCHIRSNSGMVSSGMKYKFHFCPFCGAEIVCKENLKLRLLEKTSTIPSYYYEEVN